MRAAIAPCIESVFLLDRLFYLHEQVTFLSNCLWLLLAIMKLMQATSPLTIFCILQGHNSACIVRLFDPVRSPRCYSIIASKAWQFTFPKRGRDCQGMFSVAEQREREFQSVPRYTKALLTCHFDSLYSDTEFHSLQGQTYTCNK